MDEIKEIFLDSSVVRNDAEFGEIHATQMWYENNTIAVRWVDEKGRDCVGDLTDEDQETIWEIIQSIEHNN